MEVDSNGWQLLSALSLLVREGDAVAEVCKYLIITLPAEVENKLKFPLQMDYLVLF